jgi:Animal haem peroxidase
MATDIAAPVEHGLDPNRNESGPVAVGLARHGIPGLRGQVAASEAHFGRMFADPDEVKRSTVDRELSKVDDGSLVALANAMIKRPGTFNPSTTIPAGFTYFGQFVDHDLTFDPTSTLGRRNTPEELPDFRTPRFDLDSLYGSGPMDDAYMYDWRTREDPGVKLLVGHNPEGPEFAAEDLPRNQQGRALIGDPRNDENLIISQLHLLFIRFHNKVVDRVRRKNREMNSIELFTEAQRIVRWHYQWIVKDQFLPLIVGEDVAKSATFEWRNDEPFMPVEFSAAAYRFGHSMVRDDYKLNDRHPNVPTLTPRVKSGPSLAGFRRRPQDLGIEWKHFFPIDKDTPPQMSMRIDASIVEQLAHLPRDRASLPYLNLRRGNDLGLPSVDDVAKGLGLDMERLSEGELLAALPADAVDEHVRQLVLGQTPLWYYVLAEARARGDGGLRLGPIGGRIVAEVINGLLNADPHSFVKCDQDHDTEWRPELSDPFGIADLIEFTLGPPQG